MATASECGRAASTAQISAALTRALNSPGGLLDHLPIGIYTCDPDGVVVQYNQRAAELWGRAPTPGDPAIRFCGTYKAYDPDGRPLDLSAAPMSEVLKNGQPVRDREVIIERPDGTRLTILANLDPLFDEDGRIIGGVNCFQDISEVKRAQAKLRENEGRLRDLLEALPAAIYTTDANGRITFYNQAAATLAGRRPELGKDEWCVTWRLFSSDGVPLPHDQCPMAVTLKENRPVRGVEAVAMRPDGTRVPFLPYPTPIRDASGALVGAVNMLVDISERKQAEARQRLLVDELNHRVKNTLATVQSLARQTARQAPSPQAFQERLEGRLIALSQAHDQLSRHNWEHADLRAIASASLSPYQHDGKTGVTIAGDSIELTPKSALTFAMIFHELATNAAKYGALSQPSGRLEVCWKTEQDRLRIHWRESDGPAVMPPGRRGFGTLLVERGVEAELGGEARLQFAPTGVQCEIEVPLANGR